MKKMSIMLAFAVVTLSCKETSDKAGVIEDTKQATIDSMQVEMAKKEAEIARQKSIDSVKAVAAAKEQAKPQPVVIHNTTTTTEEKKRKGWSNAAKGAAIGAGVGAITGAAVSKKKGEGAIIGGLAGAGVGAGTGAILDSEKKKREEANK